MLVLMVQPEGECGGVNSSRSSDARILHGEKLEASHRGVPPRALLLFVVPLLALDACQLIPLALLVRLDCLGGEGVVVHRRALDVELGKVDRRDALLLAGLFAEDGLLVCGGEEDGGDGGDWRRDLAW